MVPLFLVSLQRAEELIEAMEARCYVGGKGRTHLIHLQARLSDYIALASVVALAALVIQLDVADAEQFLWRWITVHLS
jgi:energy-coupling factor transport system permease protein